MLAVDYVGIRWMLEIFKRVYYIVKIINSNKLIILLSNYANVDNQKLYVHFGSNIIRITNVMFFLSSLILVLNEYHVIFGNQRYSIRL